MTDQSYVPPPDYEARARFVSDHPEYLELSPVARELALTAFEWSYEHGTQGVVPDAMVGRLMAVAEARCLARGEDPA